MRCLALPCPTWHTDPSDDTYKWLAGHSTKELFEVLELQERFLRFTWGGVECTKGVYVAGKWVFEMIKPLAGGMWDRDMGWDDRRERVREAEVIKGWIQNVLLDRYKEDLHKRDLSRERSRWKRKAIKGERRAA